MEGERYYNLNSLILAKEKFEEALTLRPGDAKADEWVKRIDKEIAERHIRNGYYAYKNGDYKEALNQWYSVLLIKKEDPGLVAKIAEVENTIKHDENQTLLKKAFDLYGQGKLVPAYREFEKAMQSQPGERQTQKFASQLKDEIATNYFKDGNNYFAAKQYLSAQASWREAKNWGYNAAEANSAISRAQRARAAALAAAEAARKAELEAQQAPQEVTPEEQPDETIPDLAPADGVPTQGIGQGDFPTSVNQQPGRVSEEARQASIERYKTGLSYFNIGNFESARQEWQAAVELNPENADASAGLKKIEAQYSNR